jgi:hypothetical protein
MRMPEQRSRDEPAHHLVEPSTTLAGTSSGISRQAPLGASAGPIRSDDLDTRPFRAHVYVARGKIRLPSAVLR